MEKLSIIKGHRLKEETEVAEYFRKALGNEKAILYCHSMSCYSFCKHKIGMAEYWKKVIEILENPLPKLK